VCVSGCVWVCLGVSGCVGVWVCGCVGVWVYVFCKNYTERNIYLVPCGIKSQIKNPVGIR